MASFNLLISFLVATVCLLSVVVPVQSFSCEEAADLYLGVDSTLVDLDQVNTYLEGLEFSGDVQITRIDEAGFLDLFNAALPSVLDNRRDDVNQILVVFSNDEIDYSVDAAYDIITAMLKMQPELNNLLLVNIEESPEDFEGGGTIRVDISDIGLATDEINEYLCLKNFDPTPEDNVQPSEPADDDDNVAKSEESGFPVAYAAGGVAALLPIVAISVWFKKGRATKNTLAPPTAA